MAMPLTTNRNLAHLTWKVLFPRENMTEVEVLAAATSPPVVEATQARRKRWADEGPSAPLVATSTEERAKGAAEAGASEDAFCERWTKRQRYLRCLPLPLALILELPCFSGVHIFHLPLKTSQPSHQRKIDAVGGLPAQPASAPPVAPPPAVRTKESTASAPPAGCRDDTPEEGEVDPDPAGRVAIPTPSCVLLSDDDEKEEVPLVRRRGRGSLETGDQCAPTNEDIPWGTTTGALVSGGMSKDVAATDATAASEVPPAVAGVDPSAGAEPQAMEAIKEIPAAPRVLSTPMPPSTAAGEAGAVAATDAPVVPEDTLGGPPVAMEVNAPLANL